MYLLISRALIAPEVVFGVGVGVATVVALDAVATVDVVGLTEDVVGLTEDVVGLTEDDVVNVRLVVLDEDETTTELLFAGFEDVYSYD
jgi:hypothetical protein